MQQSRVTWKRVTRWLAVAVIGYILLLFPSLYGDFLWFAELNYGRVFLTILGIRIGLFAITGTISFIVLYASYRYATRNRNDTGSDQFAIAYIGGIIALTILIGLNYAGTWNTVLRFLYATPFESTDPVFGYDIAFYVYTLPVLNLTIGFILLVTLAGLGVSLAVYARPFIVQTNQIEPPIEENISFDFSNYLDYLRANTYTHVSAYIGVLLIVQGFSFYLDRYELLYSTRGAVYGMGATDQTVYLPLLSLLAITAVLGGLVVLVNTRVPDARAVYIPIALLIGFLILGTATGVIYQDFVVEPDEFNKEKQYLTNEIEYTNLAFALDRVDEREFPVTETLTREQVENNPGTIDNIRLWDPRPLLTTYNELQIFRTYYQFNDVDIDRYEINGQETQVMVSARELEFEALPTESQTWVNRHLVYTHGFGIAMSPVSEITTDGLPEFFVKDIPPNSTVGIDISQPRIYYGETTTDYAIVNTRTQELDFPQGGQNVYTSYDGNGGVILDSTFRKLIYALKFTDARIFLSDSVTQESRFQFNRDIQTRAPTIAPFLEYDRDPYIVTANGELYWIYDAYTTTDKYPYSQPTRFKGDQANYVRNSVKVVINAHTGETTYYVAEPDDPLIQTYQKAFPELFAEFDDMPSGLHEHVRYPEDAFRVQAHQYLNYHMTDPQVFYNKEDAWRIPNEVTRGQESPMEPYYIIMTFPGEQDPEFVMIQPYIPQGRQNLIGWLAARSDPPNYGTLRSFLFSKQRLIFGPMQVESRIDQDAEISQQITLWSESGSSVIRGNLLAIPIDDTVIYVEPLFLESREEGALPELKRVILTHGDSVVMQPTLEQAIAVQVGAKAPDSPTSGMGLSESELERAQTLYAEANEALRQGDFATYAQKITELGELLEETPQNNTGP